MTQRNRSKQYFEILVPQTHELAQFDSVKSDHYRALKEWEKASPKAASVFG